MEQILLANDLPKETIAAIMMLYKIMKVYVCTLLTKHIEKKKLDGNCTIILRGIVNKSWKQHPKKQQLYGHLPPISKTIQIRRTTHAGEVRTNS